MSNPHIVKITLGGEAVTTCRISAGDQFTVAANLAFKWYDQILAGTKKVEHRDASNYWYKHLFKPYLNANGVEDDMPASSIKFSRGYTKANMTWTITRIDLDVANQQYHIYLGERIA